MERWKPGSDLYENIDAVNRRTCKGTPTLLVRCARNFTEAWTIESDNRANLVSALFVHGTHMRVGCIVKGSNDADLRCAKFFEQAEYAMGRRSIYAGLLGLVLLMLSLGVVKARMHHEVSIGSPISEAR